MPLEPLRIAWLYPQELNLYGDTGNITVLNRRLEWRKIPVETMWIRRGAADGLRTADLVYIGGGQDAEQIHVATDLLQQKRDILVELVANGVPMLAVCAGYQLFGRQYVTTQGSAVQGLGLLPVTTQAQLPRLTGRVIGQSDCFGMRHQLVGFENHAGRTELDSGVESLAKLELGSGNNGVDKTEGVINGNIIGTYLHGPVLSVNPWLADELLGRALARRGFATLEPLSDDVEERAASDYSRSR